MEQTKRTTCRKVLRKVEAIIDQDLESMNIMLQLILKEMKEQEMDGTVFAEDLMVEVESLVYEVKQHLNHSQIELRDCCTDLYDQVIM